MEDRPHMNGGLRQENSIPMHLTNGYADNNNTMANVSVTKTLLHEALLYGLRHLTNEV